MIRKIVALNLIVAMAIFLLLHYFKCNKFSFDPQVHVGESFSNVFSRTVAFHAPPLEDLVSRISGTGVYVAEGVAGGRLVLVGSFLYDGRPESKGTVELRDYGSTSCWNTQCATATDASGLLYNAFLWGEPKAGLRRGMRWTVDLAQPWELGSVGRQKVTVVSIDRAERTVIPKREWRIVQ